MGNADGRPAAIAPECVPRVETSIAAVRALGVRRLAVPGDRGVGRGPAESGADFGGKQLDCLEGLRLGR
jgi:hypothetical protein